MTDRERLVVANERQVERLALEGEMAETRAALLARLFARFVPDARLATPEETRLLLAEALRTSAVDDPLLAATAASLPTAPAAWLGATDALDDAIGALERACTPMRALKKLEASSGATGARAGTLARAWSALDRGLEAAGLVDGRAAARLLATALDRARSEDVVRALGTSRIRARHVLAWDAADLVWWRALSRALERAGGAALIELPAFDHPLDAERDRDPLEILIDDLARRTDEAPETAPLRARLGDLRLEGAPPLSEGVEIRASSDATAQAHAVVDAVVRELARGTPIEALAVALPSIDEEILVPLRVAFDEARIPFHDTRGPAPAAAPIVAFALRAHRLASRELPRREVAMLLRSRYLDARALTGEDDAVRARAKLLDLARVLDETPTVAAVGAMAALEETARAGRNDARGDLQIGPDSRAALAHTLSEILSSVERAATRGAHARAARELWSALGLPGRAGFDARRTLATDDVPEGLSRAELLALARDAHAWDVLMRALDAYEGAIGRTHLARRPASSDVFRHELERALEAGAPPPGAGRVGAVRVARLAELAGSELTCLVVMDANEGALPSAPPREPLLSEAILTGLREDDPRAAPVSYAVRAARELASLALAAASAQRVVLLHRLRGEDGAALAPAPLVAWLARGGVTTTRWGFLLGGAAVSARARRLRALASMSGEEAARLAGEPVRRAAVESSREDAHGRVQIATNRLTMSDVLAAHVATRTGASTDDPLPVTALERFARCPFQGYASQILGARDRAARGDTPDAREHGILVHDALAAAFVASAALWRARPRDAERIRALALEAAASVLRRDAAHAPLRRVALDRARDDVVRVLEWSLADDTWDFAHAERSFGEASRGAEDAWPALVVEAQGTRVALRGRIDRVDIAHDGEPRVRVVDYKTSKSTGLVAMFRDVGTTVLQVPLYARVAAEALRRAAAVGVYLPLGDLAPGYASPPGFQKKWNELFAEQEGEKAIDVAVSRLIGRVRSGELAPRPIENRMCPTCSFDGGCRRPRFVVDEWEDEA